MNVARSPSEQIPNFPSNPGFHRDTAREKPYREGNSWGPSDVGTQSLVDRSSLNEQALHWEPSHYKGANNVSNRQATMKQGKPATATGYRCSLVPSLYVGRSQ